MQPTPGGGMVFIRRAAATPGFGVWVGNDLIVCDGYIAGRVARPVPGQDGEVAAMRRPAGGHGVRPADILAAGDGANDPGMPGVAGPGVAFDARPAVAAVVEVHIAHGDLTALLYLQGYRQAGFVTPPHAGPAGSQGP